MVLEESQTQIVAVAEQEVKSLCNHQLQFYQVTLLLLTQLVVAVMVDNMNIVEILAEQL